MGYEWLFTKGYERLFNLSRERQKLFKEIKKKKLKLNLIIETNSEFGDYHNKQ